MPDSIWHPGFLDSLLRGNDTDGCFIEFMKTFEKRYILEECTLLSLVCSSERWQSKRQPWPAGPAADILVRNLFLFAVPLSGQVRFDEKLL